MAIKGANEKYLCQILNELWPGQWVTEHMGIEGRRFKFDVANPSEKIAIEIEGGIYTYGRHNRPTGYIQDMEKYNSAAIEGWRVLRYLPEHVHKILDRDSPSKIRTDLVKLIGLPRCGPLQQTTLSMEGKAMQVQARVV